jgi:hypothetical protein
MVDTGIHEKADWPFFIRVMNKGGLTVSGISAEESGKVYLRASDGEFDPEPGQLRIVDGGKAVADEQSAALVGDAALNAELVAAMRERHPEVAWPA